jgi:hypothetical protein
MGFGGDLRSLVVKVRREGAVCVFLLVYEVGSRNLDIQSIERLQ